MELNREQIIKALLHCIWQDCVDCPYAFVECESVLPQNALSLINELTEEVNDLKEDKELYSVFCEDYKKQVKKLTEENERLREDNEIKSKKRVSTFEIVNAYERARADTVSEIKTRFAMHYGTYTSKDMTLIAEVFRLLDQIAKEMVECTK